MKAPLVAPGIACALLVLLVPPVSSYHLADGAYRCDGGWCEDGRTYELDCNAGGCRGRTDGFTTILSPAFGDGDWLHADDWVLGLEWNGVAKAYPVRIISGQQGWEMVSDQIGNEPIAVTYCPLCASGIVFSRELAGDVLDFRNSGAIWKWDLVMWDQQTRTLWSQVGGHGIHGPLQDHDLRVLPARMMRWQEWHGAYPDTMAMTIPHDPEGEPLCTCPPVALRPAQLVHGIVSDGQAMAFRLGDMDDAPWHVTHSGLDLVAVRIGDAVHVYETGGQRFVREGNDLVGEDGRRFHGVTGRADDAALAPVAGKTTLATRWEAFHPETVFAMPDADARVDRRESPVPLACALVALALVMRRR